MGNDYKTFLGVPGSFFLHGWQWFFCGHVCDAPNIIFKPYRELPLYPRTEPHCRLPCQSNAKNIRLNSSATCAIMVQTLWMLPCMSRRVAPTLNATGPKKEASFCKKPCLASMDPLSVCVYACTRGSCVDSIWLWVRKETFSKPVFGVSKPSISGFVAVGPHCIYTPQKTHITIEKTQPFEDASPILKNGDDFSLPFWDWCFLNLIQELTAQHSWSITKSQLAAVGFIDFVPVCTITSNVRWTQKCSFICQS